MKSCNEILLFPLSYFDLRWGPKNGLNARSPFDLLTGNFNVLSGNFDLTSLNFYLVSLNFYLVSQNFDLVSRIFDIICRDCNLSVPEVSLLI